jgi:hypothetical protein
VIECLPSKHEALSSNTSARERERVNERESMWAATGKAIGSGLPKPIGIMTPHVLDSRHGTTGFSVCPAEFQSYFGVVLP